MIFISYKSQNLDKVQTIVDYLEKKGIPCWFAARDIPKGSDWPDAISNAIENFCDIAFFVLTPEFIANTTQTDREIYAISENPKYKNRTFILNFGILPNEFPPKLSYYKGSMNFHDFHIFDDSALEEAYKSAASLIADNDYNKSQYQIENAAIKRFFGKAERLLLPPHIHTICSWAFADTNIKSIKLPSSLEILEDFAFDGCNELQTIEIDKGIKTISSKSLANTKWYSSAGVMKILDYILIEYCGNQDVVVLDEKITMIADKAFLANPNIKTVIAKGVTIVGNRAFEGCLNLEKVELAENCQIGKEAFRLTKVKEKQPC